MRRRMQVAGGSKKAGNRWISGNFWPSGALYSQAKINLIASDAAPARSNLAAERDFARGIITLKVISAAAVFAWQMVPVAGSDGATPGSVRPRRPDRTGTAGHGRTRGSLPAAPSLRQGCKAVGWRAPCLALAR